MIRSLTRREGTTRAATAPVIDIAAHLKWARAIARGVARDWHFGPGSHEEDELEATAYLVLVEYQNKFDDKLARAAAVRAGRADYDADGAFRGLANDEVHSRCRREAVRLRNGGTFHTARDPLSAPRVSPLPRPRCASCSDVTGGAQLELSADADRRRVREPEEEREEEEVWSVCDTTPDE